MATPNTIQRYGWKRSNPDIRDHKFAVPALLQLPRYVNLMGKGPPIWNQGNLGSCTAHAVLRAYVTDRIRQNLPVFMPSRLFQYYNSRWLEGSTLFDVGATTRDAIRAVGNWGTCDEALWPYSISQFNKQPPKPSYTEAVKHKAINYEAVSQDIYSLKATLASGFPVVFGFTVYENFERATTAHTGMMYLPDGRAMGGHCVACVGYNSNNHFLCANSWGTKWGDPDFPGYFWMPPEYITNSNLAADFWVIKAVT